MLVTMSEKPLRCMVIVLDTGDKIVVTCTVLLLLADDCFVEEIIDFVMKESCSNRVSQ